MKKWLLYIAALMMAVTAQADVLGEYSFVGTLGDKIPMRLKFAVNADDIAVGEVFYPKAKNPAPILVVGAPTENGWYCLKEYQDDGTITGILSFCIEGEGSVEGAYISEGTWTNPKTGKSFPMKHFKKNDDAVNGPFDVTDFLDYDQQQDFDHEYVYYLWNPQYERMLGGTVRMTYAGKNKWHFMVSNTPGSIAEGRSAPDRPAILGETTHDYFYYEHLNECDYGFSAHFFKRFVVLKTTSSPETLGCFKGGGSFDGVYIKVKK